jgi:PKD domain
MRRFKILRASLSALALALAFGAAPAGAVVTNTAAGPVSYLPLNGAVVGHGASPIRSTVPTGKPPLEYHGGPVMHSQTSYAIFWAPSGYSFPSGYADAITGFLKNVAADSGKPSNVYSVSAQYTDEAGHATYSDAYGGSVNDTHAYPSSGTCAPYTGLGGESFTACISDEKMAAEVNAVIAEKGWPHGLGAEYYVVLPPHAGSCFETTGEECFDTEFCAYHNYEGASETIYANISYSPGDPLGCGVSQYPNGNANGNVDDTLSGLSHEANESITDPTLEAWYDEEGFENGDECRNTPFGEDFGAPLGGSAGTLFNEAIGSGHYYLQQEWSNDVEDCAQRVEPATPAIADPGELVSGQDASFSASESTPGSGGIASYGWEFGDGTSASGIAPTHAFQTAGVFTVTLTIEDDGGFSYSTTRQVTVVPPPLPPLDTIAVASGIAEGTATLNGSVDPRARDTRYHFEYGTTTAYGSATPEVDAGSGTGALPVSATVGGLAPNTTYHYRLVAGNSVGSTATPDLTFTTTPTPPQSLSSTSPHPPSTPHPQALKCRRGFKKKTTRGKARCVKVRHKKHRPRPANVRSTRLP